jgi:hypothetical protein
MRQDRNITQRKYNDVKAEADRLKAQLDTHMEKDGEIAIFAKATIFPEVTGGPVKGVVHLNIAGMAGYERVEDGYIKFSEIPRLIKFLTTVAGKNGIPLG